MTLKELQEKRNTLAEKIREHGKRHDPAKGWTNPGEDEQEWKRVNDEYNVVMRDMEAERSRSTAAAEVEARLNAIRDDDKRGVANPGEQIPGREDTRTRRPIDTDNPGRVPEETRAVAIAGWMRGQMGEEQTEPQIAAMRSCRIRPWQRSLDFNLLPTRDVMGMVREFRSVHPTQALARCEQRALSAYTDTAGGVLVPETLLRTIEINMLAFGGMRQVAETMVTSGGERISWPTVDDTTNTGEQLGESASIGASVDPTFGLVVWDAYKFSSKPILVPYEALQDSVIDLPRLLGELLGERLGRITNTKFTTGSGAATPKGIVTAAALGVTAASATVIAPDEIFSLVHSVDPAYRSGNNSGFMMHDTVLLALRKLKDTTNQYLWQSGMREGVPDRLVGYPLTINQDMASSVTNSAKTILFGQLGKYKIRRAGGMRMYRLEERYRDNDQDGFIALIREDGNLLSAGTAPVKYLQQLA